MKNILPEKNKYFPHPESKGGWRLMSKRIDTEVASKINFDKLDTKFYKMKTAK